VTQRFGRSAAVLLLLVIAPMLVGTAYAAAAALGLAGTGAEGFTTQRLTDVLGQAETWRSLAWTVCVAGVATLAALGAAVWSVAALWESRLGRRLAVLPLAVPHVAGALGILLLLGQSGLFARLAYALGWIHAPGDYPAMIYDRFGVGLAIAFFWKEFPFLALTAFAARAGIASSVIEAARSLGGTPRQVERAIVRPLVVRGIMPATISVFAYLLGQFEMASLLGPSAPPAFAVLTFERTTDPVLARRGEAYVLALVALTLTLALVWWYSRASRDISAPDQ
jgi:putative spermidine/putrescine transport system permease protein